MGAYAQRKLEHLGGSEVMFKFYASFILPVCTIFSIVQITWNVTVEGYSVPIYLLLDFILCVLSICALISMSALDGHTYCVNLLFLVAQSANKVYRTFFVTSSQTDMPVSGGMDIAMGGGMVQDGSMMDGMGSEMLAQAMNNPELSFVGNLMNKMLLKSFPDAGDLSGFLKTLECEVFVGLCLMFVIFFIAQTKFFFTPLKALHTDD